MIKPTKRRLTILFTLTIILFNTIVLAISMVVMNHSLIDSMKDHIVHDFKDEFFPRVIEREFEVLEAIREHELFQVYSREGQLATGTWGFRGFDLPLDKEKFAGSFAGRQSTEQLMHNGERYLVIYLPIDAFYAGRVAMPLTATVAYEANFLKLVFSMLPVMLLFTFIVSWYLVRLAMKPISDVFTFQENFSSNVTHELRTPLTSLKGNLEVALRKKRGTEEYKDTLKLGLKEVGRIITLINNLYMLASSKFKPLELLQNEANMKELVEETLGVYKADIAAKNITLKKEYLDDVICVCDSSLMRRAVENLVDNAVKYTPEGGTVSIRLSKEGHSFILAITNTCEGLNRDDIKNIFEPFHRGENALNRNIEGKGLGLYISRYILRSHGGDMRVKIVEDGLCTVEIVNRAK